MALKEYVGAVVLEIDGVEHECESVNPTTKTGRKRVVTMNRENRAKGIAHGTTTFDLTVTVPIGAQETFDWAAVEGAKLTIFPATPDGVRVSYLDFCVEEVGEKYTVDKEAMRDLKGFALRRIEE